MPAVSRSARALVAGILVSACAEAPLTPDMAGGPVTLDIVSGDGQVAVAGTELPAPLKVRAMIGSKKLPNFLVNFRVIDGAGHMYAGAAITDRDGVAQDWWTLGNEVLTTQRVDVVAVDPSTGAKQHFGTFTAKGASSAAAALQIAPASVDYGSANIGTATASTIFTITNTGVAGASGITVALSGAGAASFETTGDSCTAATLAYSQTCTVAVRFNPQAAGATAATLTVTPSAGTGASASLAGIGVGSPALAIAPPSFNFGSTVVGNSSATQTFTITNSGNGASGALSVQLAGAGAWHFVLGTDTCSNAPLVPGATCSVVAYFAPTTAGPKTATLVVTGSPGGTVSAALTGTGVAPAQLSLTPSTYDFGVVYYQSPGAYSTFTVTNMGGAPTGAVSIGLTGPGATAFTITSSNCAALGAGASCNVVVRFLPPGGGSFSATLTVGASPGGSDFSSLIGTGSTIPLLSASPASLSFGPVSLGASAVTQNLTITNIGPISTGALAVAITGANAGDFAFGSSTCAGATLVSGQSCQMQVRFQPTAVGTRTGSITIFGANGPSILVNMSGTGVALSITPVTYNFGSVDVGVASPYQTFTITNTGGTSTGLLATVIGGVGSTAYAMGTNTCLGNTLAAGASCTIEVRFQPPGALVYQASLQVSASPGGAVSASLTGLGVSATSPLITVAPTSYTYPVTAVQSSNVFDFVVTNTGAAVSSAITFSISGANTSEFSVVATSCNAPLNPGQGCHVSVRFLPTRQGTFAAQLNVLSSAPTAVAQLSGTSQ